MSSGPPVPINPALGKQGFNGAMDRIEITPFAATAATVALGEAAVCYMLGLPLVGLLHKRFGEELAKY